MKLLSYFSDIGNSYIVGPNGGGEAVLIEPSRFDVVLLNLIESGGFEITTILLTHSYERHIKGLRILKKIYKARIISGSGELGGLKSEIAEPGDRIEATGIIIETLDLGERLTQSRIFRIENFLFTGSLLSAGHIEDFASPKERESLIACLKEKILTMPEELLILPSCGPPSTIGAELCWNPNFDPKTTASSQTRSHDNQYPAYPASS